MSDNSSENPPLPTWQTWAELHARLFGFLSNREVSMVAQWAAMLRESSFTVAEAIAASKELVQSAQAPASRQKHLAALMGLVRQRRLDAAARSSHEQRMARVSSRCRTCDGTGGVSVPNLSAYYRTGRLYLGRVCCSCPAGQDRAEQWNNYFTSRKMTNRAIHLADYEIAYPNWRDTIESHRQARTLEAQASHLAERLDDELGRIDRITRDIGKE